MRPLYIIIAALWVVSAGIIVLVTTGLLDPSADDLVARAEALESGKRFAEAKSALRNAIQLRPRHAPAHLRLSQVLLRQCAFIDALKSYYDALEADPLAVISSDFNNYVSIAAGIEKRQAFLEACVQLARETRAEPVRPEYIAALHLAGYVELRKGTLALQEAGADLAKLTGRHAAMVAQDIVEGRLGAAIKMLEERQDTSKVARAIAAQLARAHDHCEAAGGLFESAIRLNDRFLAARLGLAMVRAKTGAAKAGTRLVLSVVDDIEDPPLGLLMLAARLLAQQGRIGDAEEFVGRVLHKEPDNIHARYLQGVMFFSRGDFEGLGPVISFFRRNSPGDARVMFLEGSVDLIQGRFGEAVKRLAQASGRSKRWELLQYHLGLAQYRVGGANQAEQSFLELCEWRDVFPEARLARAAVALTKGRLETAEKSCRRVLDSNPEDPDALRLLAAVQISRRDADAAIATLKEYLKMRPKSALGIQALAAARIADDEAEAVIAEHEARVKSAADPEVHHRVLALAYSLAGRRGLAESHYESLREADPSAPHPWLLRARALALAGRVQAAAAECRNAIAGGASAPAIMNTLGVLNTMQGRYYEAREELAVGPDPFAGSTFVIDVYFALAQHKDYAAAAAEILTADLLSTKSQDLLVTVHSAGGRGGELKTSLRAMIGDRPGVLGVLNKTVILRQQEAINSCRLRLIELDSMWPRLVNVYKRHPVERR